MVKAYDAPLGFPAPSMAWRQIQALKGTNSTVVTAKDVPGTDLSGKWILISGANNGIGREAALAFARWGANLILACRDPPPHEQHPSDVVEECLFEAKARSHVIECEWWQVDMSDLESIDSLAQRWLATGRPLDILCNNAGTSTGGPEDRETTKGLALVHTVNYTSHVLLTLRLLPSLAQAPQPRIVCTTSCMQFLGDFSNLSESHMAFPTRPTRGGPYPNNKLYFQMWITEMQQRLLKNPELKHITINGLNPGYVDSGIYLNHGKDIKESWPAWFLKKFTAYLAIDCQQGSLAIQHLATSPETGPNPAVQGVGAPEGKGGGRYFNRIWEAESMPHVYDADARERVWRKVSEELKLEDRGLLDALRG